MATQQDVREIARSLPETVEDPDRFAFSVTVKGKPKGIAWVWMERIHPKKARVPNHTVLAIRVADLDAKDFFLASEPGKYFTEPHYHGYPAILVRLAAVSIDELRALIVHAWSCTAPKELVDRFKAQSNAIG